MDRGTAHARANSAVAKLNEPAWYWSVAVALVFFYVVTSLYISFHRLLWFDEILTAIAVRMRDVRTMLKMLRYAGWDQIPPLYFLVTRPFDQLLGHLDAGLRLPSVLAFGAGLLVTFDIARRLTSGVYGLIAMSFVTSSFVNYYGYEARPYAACFLLAAIALWLWVVPKGESRIATVAFGLVALFGVALHYYFVACLAPFGILALAERRIFHPKLIAAAAGTLLSLAILYPFVASAHAGAWQESTLGIGKLQEVYENMFPIAVSPLVLIAVGVALFGASGKHMVTSMSSGERVSWLFLLVPVAGYAVSLLLSRRFVDRYVIGAVPGIVVAVSCLLWRHCRESRYLSLALWVVFGGLGIAKQLSTSMHPERIQRNEQRQMRIALEFEDTLIAEGKRNFALSNPMPYLELWYYSKHRDNYEWVSVSEPRGSIKDYVAVNFVSLKEMTANAGQTAVIAPEPEFVDALIRAGVHFRVRFAQPGYVLYLD